MSFSHDCVKTVAGDLEKMWYTFTLQVSTLLFVCMGSTSGENTCDSLMMMSGNLTMYSLAYGNQTDHNASEVFCKISIDGIGTCWPSSRAGLMVSQPCPAFFLGVRYNTSNSVYRKCLANGTWALKGNYSQCRAILNTQRKSKLHYQIAVIINYMGHCISLMALLFAFTLFLCLRAEEKRKEEWSGEERRGEQFDVRREEMKGKKMEGKERREQEKQGNGRRGDDRVEEKSGDGRRRGDRRKESGGEDRNLRGKG
ncbi:hypothetical protein ACEWY4_003797 [Coilia grayii]|uniref:G-protein coupled receptors family 2 profile 1 domain-containing protein n=1 Tax=Coilia grayii TaxID=363190 RepID=A0ABD1KSQ8_9TELE